SAEAAAGADADVARPRVCAGLIEPRSAADRRQLQLLAWRDIEHDLRLQIREAERRIVFAGALQQPLQIALASRHQPRSAFRCAQRAFGDHRRAAGRYRAVQLDPGPAAFAYAEIDPRANPARLLLWPCAVTDDHAVDDVAVDDRD